MKEQKFDWDETVTVVSARKYDGGWPPEKASEFAGWLKDQLAEIPPEYMDSAKVEIGASSEYDSEYASIEITYSRPPTPQEIEQRRARVRERLAREVEEAERRLAWAKSRL